MNALQFQDWKGEMVDAPADLDTVVAALGDSAIVWSTGRVKRRKVHQVRYCLQVKRFATLEGAAEEFKNCVIHRANCDGIR